MKVAITGASGHIGMAVIEELRKRGYECRALAYHHTQALDDMGITYVKGEVNDPKAIRELLEGCDYLIHSAAIISINGDKTGRVRKVNVEGVRNVMQAALDAGIQRVVHISSIHAYNPLPRQSVLDESRDFVAETAYAYDKSKRDGQKVVLDFVNKGLNAVIINPTSVTGPPDHRLSYQGKAVLDIYNGKIPALFKGGFDWVDIRDVAHAICNALTMGKAGQNYILAGKYYTMQQVVGIVAKTKGSPIRIPNVPVWMARMGVPFIKMQAALTGKEPLYTHEAIDILLHGSTNISSARAQKELQFTPRPFEETIADLIEWFKNNGYLKKS